MVEKDILDKLVYSAKLFKSRPVYEKSDSYTQKKHFK